MKKHLFIIDDDPGILDALTFLLSETYEISAITDARIAIDRLQNERPDLILIDVLMPALNGIEVIKILQKRKNTIPILVMSASSNFESRLKGFNYAGVISKPFTIDDIESMIAMHLPS